MCEEPLLLPVIMAGGSGSRLWPESRSLYPKQFLSLVGEQSMLHDTYMRLCDIEHMPPTIICGEEHRFIVAEQMREKGLGSSNVILEPIGRNTAPAIALAAFHAMLEGADPLLLVLAADHLIQDIEAFQAAVNKARGLAEQGKLVTFGIIPTAPETGYGYIKGGQPCGQGFEVEAFVEKPDRETAESYLESGDYHWNSGIFLFKASAYLSALEYLAPEIYQSCAMAIEHAELNQDFIRPNTDSFLACPDDSIDYAVMEKADNVVVVPAECGWSDVGSWLSLWEVQEKDSWGNALQGDVVVHDSRDCLVRASTKLVATVGINNLVVVDTDDAILIAAKERVQDVKKIVHQLKAENRSEVEVHRKVYRPWGYYDSIDRGQRFKVKRILVKPGGSLSLQMHHHRAEHWIVVTGTARVTKGDEVFLLSENQSTYIPLGILHRLENPGDINLEMIEVQSGSYLSEDDIVRFEDAYDR